MFLISYASCQHFINRVAARNLKAVEPGSRGAGLRTHGLAQPHALRRSRRVAALRLGGLGPTRPAPPLTRFRPRRAVPCGRPGHLRAFSGPEAAGHLRAGQAQARAASKRDNAEQISRALRRAAEDTVQLAVAYLRDDEKIWTREV